MIVFTIHRRTDRPDTVVVRCDAEGNRLIGGFGPARLSPADRGYLVPVDQVDALGRYLALKGAALVDADAVAAPSQPSRADLVASNPPLPECEHCGTPRRRNRIDRDGNVHALPAPRFCPGCGAAWADHEPGPPVQATATAIAATCPGCGNVQRGWAPHCAECGHQLPAPTRGGDPPATVQTRDPGEPIEAEELLDVLTHHLDGLAVSGAQAEINRRGLALCRAAIAEARARNPRRGPPPGRSLAEKIAAARLTLEERARITNEPQETQETDDSRETTVPGPTDSQAPERPSEPPEPPEGPQPPG